MKSRNVLALLTMLLLSGCTHVDNKIIIARNTDKSGAIVDLERRLKLDELVSEDASFMLTTYSNVDCSCWGGFLTFVLTPYVEDFHVNVYAIAAPNLGDDHLGIPYNINENSTVVFALYEKGAYKYGLVDHEDEDVFHNYKAFKTWIDRYVSLA